MRITDALLGEHGVINLLLDHVSRRAAGWNLDQAREVCASLAAMLGPHTATEERLLFEPLERALGYEPMPLAVLRLEHEALDALLTFVSSATSLEELAPKFDQLVELVGDHIAKEEGILIPLAVRSLDRDTLTRLGSRWAESRRVEAGACPASDAGQ